MQSKDNSDSLLIYIAVAAITIIVFGLDLITPLGIVSWIFYLVPVALGILQTQKRLPFIVAAVQTVLIAAGFFLSSPGAAPAVSAINRGFGVVALFAVSYLAYRSIADRTHAMHLLWLENGRVEVSRSIMGEQEVTDLAYNMLQALIRHLGAQVGVLYRLDGELLVRCASYALDPLPETGAAMKLGQGLAGSVAKEGRALVVSDLPDDYMRIASATGGMRPRHLLIVPFTADERTAGVLEIGFARRGGDFGAELQLLGLVAEKMGMALRSALYRERLRGLLDESQRQGRELQTQQEELRVANEELQESQAQLETQQDELEQANAQLEERTQLLEHQKRQLELVQQTLENNALELERANRYKSQFLANMSHELRTPLNSSLILSHMLSENKTGTLTEDQVRYAQTIHASNRDLLALINDILDLSKIEAGQIDIKPEPAELEAIVGSMRQTFEPVAKHKGVAFGIEVAPDTPPTLVTDSQRLQQILKNLLSNAFKFTESGEVVLQVSAGDRGRIRFAVRDTGIGIAEDQQEVIFEAFRQADGSTSRPHGGTGLGLSISRQLARLLGGEIRVQSIQGTGSVFTVEIATDLDAPAAHAPVIEDKNPPAPRRAATPSAMKTARAVPSAQQEPVPDSIKDDRLQRKRERLLLVIEDDEKFARILYDLAHEMHFDCIHAPTGNEAVRLAREFRPHAILLDIGLPDQSGLTVLERMKRDPATRHLPVHVISVDDYRQSALELGAVGYALKPVARDELIGAIGKLEGMLQNRVHRLLIVEDNDSLRESLTLMLAADDIEITSVGTVADALDKLAHGTFDCMVMDLMLPDASGYDLLERIAQGGKYAFPPVIVYTGRVLTREEELRLRRYSQSIIVKGARSPERLLDEVTLFLHRVEATLPADQQKLLMQARQRDAVFEGKRILVAEDDVRNVFALSSIFEPLGASMEITRNGREALERLNSNADIDLVLMDLMMPEMDGLTAMREIRKQPAFAKLPVIALTAKAMPDDRRACLEAGANDYIAKPIDVDQLVSLCRVWMPK